MFLFAETFLQEETKGKIIKWKIQLKSKIIHAGGVFAHFWWGRSKVYIPAPHFAAVPVF